MNYKSTYTVASRRSRLATVQTNLIIDLLKSHFPEIDFKVSYHNTHGDLETSKPLREFGGTGVFVKELEIAMSSEEADFAVHSLKDIPSELHADFTIAAYSKRSDPRDVLITSNGVDYQSLPKDARIGTGSPRREIQLKQILPDARFVEIRGNIDTRLKKLESGEYDAIVLALAGLNRLGYEVNPANIIHHDTVIPAAGQGILAIECKSNDENTIELLRTINNRDSEIAAFAERAFLRTMGGGCKYPMGAYAEVQGNSVHLIGMTGDLDSNLIVKNSIDGQFDEAEVLGTKLADNIKNESLQIGLVI